MDLDPYSSNGSVWYRIRTGVGPGPKVIAIVQRRKWGFWKDHAPVGNAKIQLGNEIMATYESLIEIVKLYESLADDEKEAIKFVQENSVRDGISRPFRGPPSAKQEVMPDNSKEVGKIIERVKRGTGQLAHQPLLPPPGAEAKKSSNAGMRMAFVPETMTGVINAMSRNWVADNHVDHLLPFKGLKDPPKDQGQQQQRKKGNDQNQNNRNNQGNRNNDRPDDRD